MSARVSISKQMLEWAIVRAGYDVKAYTDKDPNVMLWMEGTKNPTVRQLETFSKNVHVPFGFLLLETPPELSLDFPFFRTGKGATRNVSVNVYDMVQTIRNRQDWLVEHLMEEEYEPLDFVGSFSVKHPVNEVVKDIRKVLRLGDDWAAKLSNWENALKHLTLQVEDIDVMISSSSIVGNNTKRPIKVEECRGFVLVDKYAPFIFINSADAKAAQMFTIAHELAHIWIGESAGFDNKRLMPAANNTEKFCDLVAAEFLVPEALLKNEWDNNQEFTELSKIFKASPIVVARRALDLSLITKNEFFDFYNDYIASLPPKKQGGGGGTDMYYAVVRKKVGGTFFEQVNNAAKEGRLSYREAYRLTGVTAKTYEQYITKYLS